MSTPQKVLEFIAAFGEAPEGMLDKAFAKLCREFNPEEDGVAFLRDLLDMCVYCGACADIAVSFLAMSLKDFPETEEEKEVRRADLHERWKAKTGFGQAQSGT